MAKTINFKRDASAKDILRYQGELDSVKATATITEWLNNPAAVQLHFDGAAKHAGHYKLIEGELIEDDESLRFEPGVTYIFSGRSASRRYTFSVKWGAKGAPGQMSVTVSKLTLAIS